MMALAQHLNAKPVGFANPKLYRAAGTVAFHDILPPVTPQAVVRIDFTNGTDLTGGTTTGVATIGQAQQTLNVTRGWDNVTGLGVPNGEAFLSALK